MSGDHLLADIAERLFPGHTYIPHHTTRSNLTLKSKGICGNLRIRVICVSFYVHKSHLRFDGAIYEGVSRRLRGYADFRGLLED